MDMTALAFYHPFASIKLPPSPHKSPVSEFFRAEPSTTTIMLRYPVHSSGISAPCWAELDLEQAA
jgi:hypothetical protein